MELKKTTDPEDLQSAPIVIVESPFGSRSAMLRRGHKLYAEALMRHVFMSGGVPVASHVFFTSALDDTIPSERLLGLYGGFRVNQLGQGSFVGTDFGVSQGMKQGVERTQALELDVVEVRLGWTYKQLINKVMFPFTAATSLVAGLLFTAFALGDLWMLALSSVALPAVFDLGFRIHLGRVAKAEMAARDATIPGIEVIHPASAQSDGSTPVPETSP